MTWLIAFAATIAALWVAFVVFVFLARGEDTSMRAALRLIPDTVRLLRGITRDRTIPRRTRWLVWGLIGYLASPIDLIPDFLPVIGYADDVIVTTFVLRRVIRKAGPDKLREHWTGSPDGLASVQRLLRLPHSQ